MCTTKNKKKKKKIRCHQQKILEKKNFFRTFYVLISSFFFFFFSTFSIRSDEYLFVVLFFWGFVTFPFRIFLCSSFSILRWAPNLLTR
jgi:hypothetical protein